MKKLLFVSFIAYFFTLNAKVLVMTHAYKRPDFIPIQEKTFRKFLKDDYEFVVFNDARETVIFDEINRVCKNLGIRCITIPQEIHARPYLYREPEESYFHPCVTCANVVQYSLDILGFNHNGYVMIVDSDLFLIRNFSIKEYLENYDISGLAQNRGHVHYLWNGILFFNMNTLPCKNELSFNCGKIEGESCDVGGYTYYYFKNHPEVRLKGVNNHVDVGVCMRYGTTNSHPFLQLLIDENIPESEFFLNFTFFHYRAGGNWNYRSNEYHDHKTSALHKLIDLAFAYGENR